MAQDKVLLIDDEAEFTELLSERMGSRGLKVDTAMSGPEGLDKISQHSYDAVIVDLAMPGMDGIETLRRILEINPTLQIILLTGHATLQKGIEAVKLGALDFLEKPADLKTLMAKIEEAKNKKMVLVTKQYEDKMKDILQNKGW